MRVAYSAMMQLISDTCQHNSQKKLLSFLPSSDNPRHYRVFLDIHHVYFFMLRGEYFKSWSLFLSVYEITMVYFCDATIGCRKKKLLFW